MRDLLTLFVHLLVILTRLIGRGGTRSKPGPKGPSQELIRAIVEMKRRNPRFLYHQWQANLRILDVEEIKTVSLLPWPL